MQRDIEVKLRESEEFNRSLMDATSDCVKVLDVNGRLLHMNTPGLCAMEIDDFGSVCGREWEAIWPESARGDIERSLTKAVGGQACSFQAYCPTVKGTPKWWEVTVSPVRDADSGQILRVLAVSRDITDRKQAEERQNKVLLQLEQERGRLADVFRQAPAFMCVMRGPEHVFELSNEQYNQLTGHRDLLGLPVRKALPEVEDQGFFEVLDNVFRTGEPFTGSAMPVWLNRQRGQPAEERYVDVVCQALKEPDGAITGVIAVGVDVTDRQRAAEQLRSSKDHLRLALDAAELGAWHIDAASNALTSDERFQVIFSGQVGPITFEQAFACLHPDDTRRIADAVAAAMRPDQPVAYSEEYRVIHPDSTLRWVHGKGRALFEPTNTGQKMVSLDGTVMDITAQKTAAAKLQDSETSLRLSEERLNRLHRITSGSQLQDAQRLQAMLHLGVEEFGLENGVIAEIGGGIYRVALADTLDDSVPVGFTCDARDVLCAETLRRNDLLAIESLANSDWHKHPAHGEFGCEVYFGMPLPVGGKIFGTLCYTSSTPHKGGFSKGDHEFLRLLAQTLGTEMTRQHIAGQLSAAEERQRFALQAADAGAWEWDIVTGEIRASSANFVLYDLDPTLGATEYSEWNSRIHPDDVVRTNDSIRAAIEGHTHEFREEFRTVHRDGSILWLQGIGRVQHDASGQAIRLSGITLNITARKQAEQALRESEELFRNLADNIPQMAWIADAGTDGNISWFNKVWLDYTGATLEQMKGAGWRSVHHPDHADRVATKFSHHVRNCLDWDDTFPLRGKDGQYRWFLSRMNCIRDASGAVLRIFGTNTDVTQEREMEEELRQIAAELSQSDRRKDEFLATLAHELRNPLAPIRNGLQMIKLAAGQPATVEKARAMMDRQLTQMVRLVDDLMDVSRINQGKLELRKERLSLTTVLDSAVETSRPLIAQMGHQLTVTLPEQVLIVDADLTRLAQVFMNLLNNAAKYSERGGHIQLRVERQGSSAVVSVKDTGIGIAADQLPRIFDMFTQVSGALEKSQGGLGIGLMLVKRLLEMHGGTVQASSDGPGKGSEFVVRLPLAIQALQSPASPQDASNPGMSPLRILIVDDNRDGADSMTEMLGIMGNDTRAAYDGQQGVDVAEAFRPDVILFDIGMPKLNGYEACRLIRRQPWGRETVLIAVTGWGQEKDRERTRDAGFDHHLVKPVDPQALMAMLTGLKMGSRPEIL